MASMETLTIQIQLDSTDPLPLELIKDMEIVTNKIEDILYNFGDTKAELFINGKLYQREEWKDNII